MALSLGVSGWLPLSPGSVLCQRPPGKVEVQISGWVGKDCWVALAYLSPSLSQAFCLSRQKVILRGLISMQLLILGRYLAHQLLCPSGTVCQG